MDTAAAVEAEEVLKPIYNSNGKDVIIDCTNLEYIASSGLRILLSILKGEYINPHVSIWWYKLDSLDEVGKPDYWPKANPNIGKTVSYEAYQLDVERAEKVPAARNDILAKRFGTSSVSTVHAMTLSGWGIAGIIGPTLGNIFTGNNLFLVLGGLYLFGFTMMEIFVKKDSHQEIKGV